MPNHYFGKMIKKLRKERGLTMDQLADAINVKISRISMWENNGVVPRDSVLISLSNYFDVSVDYLLGTNKEGKEPAESKKLHRLQRGLKTMSDEDLEIASNVLAAVFKDVFNDEEDDDDEVW